MLRSAPLIALLALASAASAQTGERTAPPQQPAPAQTIPERVDPRPIEPAPGPSTAAPPREGESLSERLDRTGGVIEPPATPSVMPVIPPRDDTSRTPVLTPPGTPGGPPGPRPE
jgi:hypothetical protein